MTRSQQIEVTITALGAQADGIAQTDRGPIYVPQTAPGDQLLVALGKRRGDGFAATIVNRLADSPDRIDPPCPYFSKCGSCATQHLADPLYETWKRQLVTTALSRRGLDPSIVKPLRRTDPGTRRRVHLTARATGKHLLLGYHQRRSKELLAIDDCLVLRPALRQLFAPLHALLSKALPPRTEAKLLLTEAGNGIDLLITTSHDFDANARMDWAEFANSHNIARIEWRPTATADTEPMAVLETPRVTFAGIEVPMPSGVFLQASAQAEAIMVDILIEALGEAKSVADLFAGCGAFSLPVAKHGCHVHAVDSYGAAIAAIKAAAGPVDLGGRISGETRDLFRRPIQAKELSRFDTIIFDPPRAGAATQVAQICQSKTPRILAVSCNPASFATDARALVDAGYDLQWVIPIDQFVHSHHVELVALFTT